MHLNLFSDKTLVDLLSQSQQWLALDKLLKRYVPINLHPHFKVVCVDQEILIIYTYHVMVMTRLKLLKSELLTQLRNESLNIHDIHISQHPQQEILTKKKNFHIPHQALCQFSQTAKKVSHHEALSAALDNLVKHHQA